MSELIRRELTPYATGSNTAIEGPDLTLSAKAGQALSMVLHELATNAAKHGALSAHDGRVSVRWQCRVNGNTSPQIAIEWQETGGPCVRSLDASGYGMEVIRDLIPYELGGKSDLVFSADGLRCRLEIPEEWLSNGTRGITMPTDATLVFPPGYRVTDASGSPVSGAKAQAAFTSAAFKENRKIPDLRRRRCASIVDD